MIYKVFPVGPLQCNCSVVGDEQTREAMVIDPGDQIEDILKILKAENLTLKQIVVTHAHIDHVGGAMKLKAATGGATLTVTVALADLVASALAMAVMVTVAGLGTTEGAV